MFLTADPDSADAAHWLSKAIVGAIIAALGYVGKQIWDVWGKARRTRRLRRAQLIQLQSLLRVTKVAFDVQNEHARRLLAMLRERTPQLDISGGFEHVFSGSYRDMRPEEKEIHSLIRGITISSLRTGNSGLVTWLDSDVYFKAQYRKTGPLKSLAGKLAELHTHLILWQAKFEVWIPDKPEHALVYMADEKRHGSPFPEDLDPAVDKALKIV